MCNTGVPKAVCRVTLRARWMPRQKVLPQVHRARRFTTATRHLGSQLGMEDAFPTRGPFRHDRILRCCAVNSGVRCRWGSTTNQAKPSPRTCARKCWSCPRNYSLAISLAAASGSCRRHHSCGCYRCRKSRVRNRKFSCMNGPSCAWLRSIARRRTMQ
jgi:hypothetical protein